MANNGMSKPLFIVILLVLVVNAVISTANVIEDGILLRRVIPAACWIIAAIGWIAGYARRAGRGGDGMRTP